MKSVDPTRKRCGKLKRDGTPCTHWPIAGATVCRWHGGAAPQVKRKAQERIQAAVNPALALIEEYLEHAGDPDYPVPPAVRLAAARDILDRAGYGATHRLEMSGEMTIISPVDLELEDLATQIRKNLEVEAEDGRVGTENLSSRTLR